MSEITGYPKGMSDKDKNNAADDRLNWKHQDKSYNELYKNWRKQKRDTAGFYYVDSPNELTYQDGVGFIKNYPEAVEANALTGLNHYIGVSLLLVIILDTIGRYAAPVILHKLGVNITLDIADYSLYGNPWIIIALNLGTALLKVVYPIYICFKTLQAPINLVYPVKITNKPMFRIAVPTAFMFSGLSVVAAFVGNSLMDFLHINRIPAIRFASDDTAAKIVYLIILIVIAPILGELGARCLLLQLLRQFGDGYAIIATSILSALVTYSATKMIYVFFMSIIFSYFMMRTGSIITSIIMRISMNAFSMFYWIIRSELSPELVKIAMPCYLLLCIASGLICLIWFVRKHSDKIGMPITSRYLRFSEKMIVALSSKALILSFALIFILTIFNIRFQV